MSETSLIDRIEATILRVAKERGVVMGSVAANHMAIDVLEAIREPTPQMINAGEAWRVHCSDTDSLWAEMVSAALQPESYPAAPHPLYR